MIARCSVDLHYDGEMIEGRAPSVGDMVECFRNGMQWLDYASVCSTYLITERGSRAIR